METEGNYSFVISYFSIFFFMTSLKEKRHLHVANGPKFSLPMKTSHNEDRKKAVLQIWDDLSGDPENWLVLIFLGDV